MTIKPPQKNCDRSSSNPSILSYSTRELTGILMIFGSAICFYLATFVIRIAKTDTVITPEEFLFGRLLLGFIIVVTIMGVKKKKPRPKNLHFIFGRVLANLFAVLCFYTAVEKTGASTANVLNMTYPIFIAIISWFMIKDQRDPVAVLISVISFVGVWMILSGNGFTIDIQNLWGLMSGLWASVAIIYLNLLRRDHDSDTILFFVFGAGALFTYILFHGKIAIPDSTQFYYLFICSVLGVAGQYLLTIGNKYVTALESGIISSTRILMAAVLGIFLPYDLPLSLLGWMGAFLIFGANVYLTIRKVKNPQGL
ncbi:MAG: DMT family transporter [Desulfobacterium sp.]|jgi:drug/metabolite transporter (DMT)-like permease|nr:DMT family transporter [Desulfobacterium sp.]